MRGGFRLAVQGKLAHFKALRFAAPYRGLLLAGATGCRARFGGSGERTKKRVVLFEQQSADIHQNGTRTDYTLSYKHSLRIAR